MRKPGCFVTLLLVLAASPLPAVQAPAAGWAYGQYLYRYFVWGGAHLISPSDDYERFPYHTIDKGPSTFQFRPGDRASVPATIEYQDGEVIKRTGLGELLQSTATTAFIVTRDDRLLYESYLNGFQRDSVCISRSLGKSFISALVGIAVDEGFIKGIADPITKYLPELKGRGFEAITVKHLLTMGSGIKYEISDLPERLRPLARIVALANLIDREETNRLHGAEQRLMEASGQMIARISPRARRTDQPHEALQEQVKMASEEIRLILENFSARASEHRDAVATLLEHMRLAGHVRPDEVNLSTWFETLAAVRSVLWTVAISLNIQDDIVRLPEECNKPPASLQRVDGRIKVTVVPVSYWLLPMLDGLEAGRLKICEACEKLYVTRRRDQLGCSRKCGDTVYMRRYRNPEYRNRNKPGSKRRLIRKALNELRRKNPH